MEQIRRWRRSLTKRLRTWRPRRLNILTFSTHESFQTYLAGTGHCFYLVEGSGLKTWNEKFRPLPPNHYLLDLHQVPRNVEFDLILSQSLDQFNVARSLSERLHLPLVRLEHTLPTPDCGKEDLQRLNLLRG